MRTDGQNGKAKLTGTFYDNAKAPEKYNQLMTD
jgi:hypothetical protein